MSKLCLKCQYFVGTPLLSNTALIPPGHGIHQSCTGYLATPSPSPSAARQLSFLAVCFGVVYVAKQFLKGGHHLLLQNVTVHVRIHDSLNEPQLSSTSSSQAAPEHDATTNMLDCRQGTIFLVLLTRASPHMLDTSLP